MPENNEMHTLTIENRSKASLTGIQSVESFNEKQVNVKTLSSCFLTITGENLTVSKFNTENGTLVIDGSISEVKYSETKGRAGFINKLFR